MTELETLIEERDALTKKIRDAKKQQRKEERNAEKIAKEKERNSKIAFIDKAVHPTGKVDWRLRIWSAPSYEGERGRLVSVILTQWDESPANALSRLRKIADAINAILEEWTE